MVSQALHCDGKGVCGKTSLLHCGGEGVSGKPNPCTVMGRVCVLHWTVYNGEVSGHWVVV